MTNPKLAFVFPGQGSQKVGMLKEIARQFPVVLDTFAEASDALGYDLWNMVQHGEQQQLNLTERTQPILLTSSIALWRVWTEREGMRPAMMFPSASIRSNAAASGSRARASMALAHWAHGW